MSNTSDRYHFVLEEPFSPLAPSLMVIKKRNYKYKSLIKTFDEFGESSNYLMWLHHGDGYLKKGDVYSSIRVPLS